MRVANGTERLGCHVSAAGDDDPVGDSQPLQPEIGVNRLTSGHPGRDPDSVDRWDHGIQPNKTGERQIGQEREHGGDDIVVFVERHDHTHRGR